MVAAATKAAPSRPTPAPRRRAADTRPKGFVQTPILAVLPESTDIKTFRVARPMGSTSHPASS
ncbi:MAG: hypothetical protein R2708_26600 [Vicinamibacterales bacterium]